MIYSLVFLFGLHRAGKFNCMVRLSYEMIALQNYHSYDARAHIYLSLHSAAQKDVPTIALRNNDSHNIHQKYLFIRMAVL